MIIGDISKGLVLHQPLDIQSLRGLNDLADKTPYENNGVSANTPVFTTDRMGQASRAMSFNGVSDVIDVGRGNSLNLTDGFTMSVWVKPNAAVGYYTTHRGIISTGDYMPHSYGVYWNSLAGELIIALNGTQTIISPFSYVDHIGLWSHIMVTYDKNNVKTFVNNTQIGNDYAYSDPIADNIANVLIGYSGLDRWFIGDIAEMRIYNRAISQDEITALYEQYRPKLVISDINKGLVLHQPLDKESLQSATTFADKTPYENVGTSANVPVFTTDRMGQNDRAMSFNGVDDYVDCGNDESLNFGTEDFSISMWVYPQVFGDHTYLVKASGWAVGNVTAGPYIGEYNGSIIFETRDGSARNQGKTNGGLLLNTWNNINCVRKMASGGSLEVYINGTNKSLSYGVGTNFDADLTNAIAMKVGYDSVANRNFHGSIADVRIYNRAISQDEITMLFSQYRPKLSIGSLQKGLVLDMPLKSKYTKNETVGSEIMTDRTPYSNDGQNGGAIVGTDHTTFNGSSYIRIPDSASLSPVSAMSAAVWVNGIAQNGKGILSHYDNGLIQRGWLISSSTTTPYGNIRYIVSDDGTFNAGHIKVYNSDVSAFDSTWHLVGFTFDAGTLKLFVDGVEDTNPTKVIDGAITTINNSTADIMVGCSLNSDVPTSPFTGDLARPKIWKRALTDAEWLEWYNKTKGLLL